MRNFGYYAYKKNPQIDQYDTFVDARFEIIFGLYCIEQRILYYRIINWYGLMALLCE